MLDLARDEACVNCGSYDGVVAAHSNRPEHGKGMSIKAHDCLHAHLCFACHAWADQGSGLDPTEVWGDDEKAEWMNTMILRTVVRLWMSGKVKVR